VEPFFFDADPGTRFSLYHAPESPVAPRGSILYVHPFAGELSRTRRMAALQSRAFAALGYAVLQIDLFGCGDSCGEFNAGRWQIWQRDLALAAAWLADRGSGPLTLWGLRLGGLLALDAALRRRHAGVLLWQPYMSGRACINQFLRLSEPLQDPGARGAAQHGGAARAAGRARRDRGRRLYEVAVPLVKAIDACDAAHVALPPCPCTGSPAAVRRPRQAASAARLGERWARPARPCISTRSTGCRSGPPDRADCPALLPPTCDLFTGDPA
jgi:exosortase A-associated hydrolase 2